MALSGLAVPAVTLFGPDGELDLARNARFTRAMSESKVDHVFSLGSMGEFPCLTDEERIRLLESVIESLSYGVDAWVGVGAPSTRQAVKYAREAEGAGAAALVAVPPYYLHPGFPAIDRYYRAIRSAVELPVLAYNIPSLVGYSLPPSLVHALARDGVLAGVKDTSGSLESVRAFLTDRPDSFVVVPGDDELALASIGLGASGAVMGIANVVPKLCVELVRAAQSGDGARASELQGLVHRVLEVRHVGPFPSTDKFLAHELWNADVGYRSPYDALSREDEERVRQALAPLRPSLKPFLPG